MAFQVSPGVEVKEFDLTKLFPQFPQQTQVSQVSLIGDQLIKLNRCTSVKTN